MSVIAGEDDIDLPNGLMANKEDLYVPRERYKVERRSSPNCDRLSSSL
jgi:hypothetical protein